MPNHLNLQLMRIQITRKVPVAFTNQWANNITINKAQHTATEESGWIKKSPQQVPYRGRPDGSWRLWQSHFHSWPGCCHQTYSQFLPCRSPRGWKPSPAWGFHSPWCLEERGEEEEEEEEVEKAVGLIRQQIEVDKHRCIFNTVQGRTLPPL